MGGSVTFFGERSHVAEGAGEAHDRDAAEVEQREDEPHVGGVDVGHGQVEGGGGHREDLRGPGVGQAPVQQRAETHAPDEGAQHLEHDADADDADGRQTYRRSLRDHNPYNNKK